MEEKSRYQQLVDASQADTKYYFEYRDRVRAFAEILTAQFFKYLGLDHDVKGSQVGFYKESEGFREPDFGETMRRGSVLSSIEWDAKEQKFKVCFALVVTPKHLSPKGYLLIRLFFREVDGNYLVSNQDGITYLIEVNGTELVSGHDAFFHALYEDLLRNVENRNKRILENTPIQSAIGFKWTPPNA